MTSMTGMTRAAPAAVLALLLALAGAPAQAMTGNAPAAPRAGLGQGVLEKVSGANLRISGKDYTLVNPGAVFERSGARAGSARLAAAKTVAFSLSGDAPTRIKELWIID